MDLTPATLWDATVPGLAISESGYQRFWYNAIAPADMLWDNNCADPVAPTERFWVVRPGTPPAGETAGCNTRWQHAVFTGNCSVSSWNDQATGAILHNCSSTGGSSGAPLWGWNAAAGQVQAVGLHSGGFDATDTSTLNAGIPPEPCDTNQAFARDGGPATKRFIHAPRFAGALAVSRRPDGANATGVYATDNETVSVNYRERSTTSPLNFQFWKNLKSFDPSGSMGSIASCYKNLTGNKTLLFAVWHSWVPGLSGLYVSEAPFSTWTQWTLPSGVPGVRDIDATQDYYGNRCEVFLTGQAGNVYTRWMTSDTAWSGWSQIATGNYHRVTGQRVSGGALWVAMTNNIGQAFIMRFGGSWSLPVYVPPPAGVTWWVDLDFTNVGANSTLYAYPGGQLAAGPTNLYVRTTLDNGTGSWSGMVTTLRGKGIGPQLSFLSAQSFLEATGTTRVLATDDAGNIYVLTGATNIWDSFYAEADTPN